MLTYVHLLDIFSASLNLQQFKCDCWKSITLHSES